MLLATCACHGTSAHVAPGAASLRPRPASAAASTVNAAAMPPLRDGSTTARSLEEHANAAGAWPAALGTPKLPSSGPIAAVGYPGKLQGCLPDPAPFAGFSSDQQEFGYCARGMFLRCELLDRSGATRVESAAAAKDNPQESPEKARAIESWIKQSGIPKLAEKDCQFMAPPLGGTWAYADITVHVLTGQGTYSGGADPHNPGDARFLAQPFVRIGGAVSGHGVVFPITKTAPHHPMAQGEIPYNVAELNVLALSADGGEIGTVVHSNCMEWCDDFDVQRMTAAHFAALVYNDTGFASYKKGDLEAAALLFARAAFIDPGFALPAYNLACAYARLGDARAEPALALAVARGGDGVKVRARKDPDFDAVRGASWFARIVG
jgi:hypothetical protein